MSLKFILTIFFVVLCVSPKAEAVIFITEILADPPSGLTGDANGDGVTSSTNDEFVEIWNSSGTAVNLSGWSLSDALNTRHTFPSASLLGPQEFLVVFGGGSSPLNIFWQAASTGTLSLNNTGDTLTLYDGAHELIDQVVYGSEGGQDQSLVRLPDGIWTRSSEFSPGFSLVNIEEENIIVPEPITFIYVIFGVIILMFRQPLLVTQRIKD